MKSAARQNRPRRTLRCWTDSLYFAAKHKRRKTKWPKEYHRPRAGGGQKP